MNNETKLPPPVKLAQCGLVYVLCFLQKSGPDLRTMQTGRKWWRKKKKNPRANPANNADLPILISVCLNLQMLKSPNFVYSIYQGIILVSE